MRVVGYFGQALQADGVQAVGEVVVRLGHVTLEVGPRDGVCTENDDTQLLLRSVSFRGPLGLKVLPFLLGSSGLNEKVHVLIDGLLLRVSFSTGDQNGVLVYVSFSAGDWYLLFQPEFPVAVHIIIIGILLHSQDTSIMAREGSIS